MEQFPSLPANTDETDPSLINLPVGATHDVAFSDASGERTQDAFMSDFAEATHDLLMEDSATKRAAAARRLAKLGRPLASPYLTAALLDNSAGVRQAAAEALGHIGDSGAIPPLQDLLARETNGEVPERAIADAINSITVRTARVS